MTRTDHEYEEPADFAAFVTLAVAGAAANIGGIEAVLAGRPGSWEADELYEPLALVDEALAKRSSTRPSGRASLCATEEHAE